MLESLWPESLLLCWRETPTGMFSVSAPVVATPVGGCCCWGVGGGAAVVLVGGGPLRGGFNVCFGWGTGHWGIIIWGFRTFLMIPNSLGSKLPLVWQDKCDMIISSNLASFHLW